MNDKPTLLQQEDKEVLESRIAESKKYYITPKYKLWEELFLNKGNKETFGNATISACVAYDLDPADPKAYNVASNIGSKNIRKSKDIARKYWEKKGLTHGKLLEAYNNIMIERKDVNMLYATAKMMGIELPKYEQITAGKYMQQQNTQINASDVQISFTAIGENKK